MHDDDRRVRPGAIRCVGIEREADIAGAGELDIEPDARLRGTAGNEKKEESHLAKVYRGGRVSSHAA